MANTRIRELTATTAAAITDPSVVQFGVDKTDIPGTRKLALSELQQLTNVNTVGTVAALATAPARDGQIWITSGYNTANDGGGNVYTYAAGSSATVDGGFVINGPGSIGRFLAVDTSRANILQFGAKTDGTNQAAAIQAAINAAGDGGTVVIPVGQFAISSTLIINKATVLQGVGKGHSGAGTAGASLKWIGATNGVMLRVNDGTSGLTVHGWIIRQVGFNGNSIAGVVGIRLGAGNDGTPRAAVGTIEACWFKNCLGQGIDCWTAQICTFDTLHFEGCGDGIKFSAGTNYANTDILVSGCRAASGTIGFHIRRLVGATFVNCAAETNQNQGFYLQTGGTDEAINDITFLSCWQEGNLAGGGTGKGEFETVSTGAGIRSHLITIINHHCGVPSSNNYNLVFDGCVAEVQRPRLNGSGQGILLKGNNSGAVSYVHMLLDFDPATYITFQAGSSAIYGTVEEILTTGGVIDMRQWVINNAAPWMWQKRHKDYLELVDNRNDATNKIQRLVLPHYTNSEEQMAAMVNVSTSTGGVVQIGGGSGAYNAATTVDVYAAANNTTLLGSKIASFTSSGMTLQDGMNIAANTASGTKIGTGSTQKLGFWNATPVAQPVLATGAGRTVDDVISMLQTIGLCKQT